MECALSLHGSWPPTSDSCDARLHPAVVSSLAFCIKTLTPLGVFIVSCMVQLLIAYLIAQLAEVGGSKSVATLYWMSPFLVFLTSSSLLGNLFHVLLLSLLLSRKYKNNLMFIMAVSILISWDYKFMSVLPLYFYSVLGSSGAASLMGTVIACGLYYLRCGHDSENNLSQSIPQSYSYYPSVGVLWYLNGQVFGTFEAYCVTLVSFQPLLYGFPLAIRFRQYPDVAVSFHSFVSRMMYC